MQTKTINKPDEIMQCFDVFLELRPNLINKQIFVNQVLTQQKEGYQIVAIAQEDEIVSCIGFRIITMLAWGRILYIDDLITKTKYRDKGHGNTLLGYVINFAKELGCDQIHLDSGYIRHAAHKLYLNNGFEFNSHHLALKVK